MALVVQKFGGTSVADPDRIRAVADHVARTRRKGETPFTDMWAQVEHAVSSVIDKTTFADLLRGWQEKQNRYVMNWEI